jgi:hypothetical protein
MGSHYWGGFYAMGLAFFVAAGLLPRTGDFAPLVFVLLWSAALLLMGVRLRRLGDPNDRGREQGRQAES